MSEEPTRDLVDNRSFEVRVFARFDDMDGRFDGLGTRVQTLAARALDTNRSGSALWRRSLK